MVNSSFLKGVFPVSFKEALMCPLLKKPLLDPTMLNNFSPVSNFPFLEKVVEKVIMLQLRGPWRKQIIWTLFKSGFRL